ncbi:MAG: hypothetical protein V7603_5038 [Micromonosporaceae bacterium]
MTVARQLHRLGDEDPLLSLAEAAERAGLKKGTWQSYVSRRYAPPPDDPDDTDTDGTPIDKFRRRPQWRASTVDRFREHRLGQGRRTDLDDRKKERRERRAAELAEPLAEPTPVVADWLETNHRALLAVAEELVDHRDALVAVAPRPEEVADAIDAAGLHMSRQPSRALASAISYAMGLLTPETLARLPEDSQVALVVRRYRRLRDEFEQIRPKIGGASEAG